MVSKASDDLPDPETPVTTVSWLWGISKSIFLRLWTRAPRTTMLSFDIDSTVQRARCAQMHAPLQNGLEATAETSDYKWLRGAECAEERSLHRRCMSTAL